MSDVATRFHENWLGLVQPIEGLVVSVPALVHARCRTRKAPSMHSRLVCPADADGRPVTDEEKAARQAFEDEALDRLFALNAERAAEERSIGGKQ